MKLPLYQIDAFANQPFTGNPAAVCPLDEWLEDALMQAIAEENNLSETVFFVPSANSAGANPASDYHIRWFTPNAEVKLCGHATLASAFVLFAELGFGKERVVFDSLSGLLPVSRDGDNLLMNFPAQPGTPCEIPARLVESMGVKPIACLKGEDYIAVYPDEETLSALQPDFAKVKQLDVRGVTATAPSRQYDFVSRFFAPKVGIDEDPVTGSAFARLAPYWAEQLGKPVLQAKQISRRGGEVVCEMQGERVTIKGRALKFLQGWIELPG